MIKSETMRISFSVQVNSSIWISCERGITFEGDIPIDEEKRSILMKKLKEDYRFSKEKIIGSESKIE